MAKFHFVEDYEKYVRWLMRKYPIDEAMSLAVGGHYETFGAIEADILAHYGLAAGQSLVDFGCGSGRLAVALSQRMEVDYLGLDVVQPLLDYARKRSPGHYRFALNPSLGLPVPDASVDMVCAFSVFTHLLPTETYIYLEEILRCLKPGGRLVMSFMELAAPNAWNAFSDTVKQQRDTMMPVLNAFLERNQIAVFVEHLAHGTARFSQPVFVDPFGAAWPSGENLGQSLAVLTRLP